MRRMLPTREFAIWMALGVPAFVACVLVLESLGVPLVFVFAGGMLFDMAVDPLCNRLLDRRDERLGGESEENTI